MSGISIKGISDDINERMATHINSMCATDDEVSIAYLLCEIDEMQKVLQMCFDDTCNPSGKITKKTAIELMKRVNTSA